jgi:hypothetical protein
MGTPFIHFHEHKPRVLSLTPTDFALEFTSLVRGFLGESPARTERAVGASTVRTTSGRTHHFGAILILLCDSPSFMSPLR